MCRLSGSPVHQTPHAVMLLTILHDHKISPVKISCYTVILLSAVCQLWRIVLLCLCAVLCPGCIRCGESRAMTAERPHFEVCVCACACACACACVCVPLIASKISENGVLNVATMCLQAKLNRTCTPLVVSRNHYPGYSNHIVLVYILKCKHT